MEEEGKSEHEQRMDRLARALKRVHSVREDDIPGKITDQIYLGSVAASRNKDFLDSQGITHILCVANNIEAKFPHHFTYGTVHVDDLPSEDIQRHFDQCFNFMYNALHPQDPDQKPGKVLVHCFAGVSRSATVVVAYLMATEGLSLRDAWDIVRKGRSCMNPNAGFCLQLKDFEKRGVKFPPQPGSPPVSPHRDKRSASLPASKREADSAAVPRFMQTTKAHSNRVGKPG